MNILPADDGKPARPDVFVLRHIEWTEIHAVQLGMALAIIVYWGQAIGEAGVAFGIIVLAIESVIGRKQKASCDSTADHGVGWHDVVREPQYAVTGALVTYIAFVAVFGVP